MVRRTWPLPWFVAMWNRSVWAPDDAEQLSGFEDPLGRSLRVLASRQLRTFDNFHGPPSEQPLRPAGRGCLRAEPRTDFCDACDLFFSDWIVEGNERLPHDPTLLCHKCFIGFHYNGEDKVGTFVHLPYPQNEKPVFANQTDRPSSSSFMNWFEWKWFDSLDE